MKTAVSLFILLILSGCNDIFPTGPSRGAGMIVVNVHWGDQGVPGIPVTVIQTQDSICTGQNGLAIFSVPGGHYVVRAYGITRGGPTLLKTDYQIDVNPGGVAILDIPDCLPCL